MHLVQLPDWHFSILEDNHNVECDRFENDSVNVMKNRLFVGTQGSFSLYQLGSAMEIVTRNKQHSKRRFVSHTGKRQTVEKLDDLEK